MAGIPLLERARAHGDRTAIVDQAGPSSYDQLWARTERAAAVLLDGRRDLDEARVGYLIAPGADWVTTQWAIWLAGGIAVPLCAQHPRPELEHVLGDSGAQTIVSSPGDLPAEIAAEKGIRHLTPPDLGEGTPGPTPGVEPQRRAMILYTSGTTGRPKGAVTTHANIRAQIESLVEAWEWTAEDRILHVLPLHHVHGIINVLCCALWSGARCDMLPRFEAAAVWHRFTSGELTLFMAVPTIYSKLIRVWEEAPREQQESWAAGARKLRLMVSGSAALPVSVLERWREITEHTLLERYGMTEIGMALSNPLHGERIAGSVGTPLPTVEVRTTDEGEILVRGPSVFLEYWNLPDATAATFDDGWFRTGDIAVVENGRYRILGRSSVDILKTGGYKVSALEIEEVLRTHGSIAECAVVGVPDAEWGERVAAAVVPAPGCTIDLESLRAWARDRMAPYKLPSLLRCSAKLPRNALGKVVKPEIRRLFATGS